MNRFITVAFAIPLLVATACTAGESDPNTDPDPDADPVPVLAAEFSLDDVNETSPTFGQPVSPRDHLGRVSAWYFGHAT